MPRLYLASNNAHKAEELSALLADLTFGGTKFEVALARALDPALDWDESGSTFAANAQIKADAVRRLTSDAVLADDSGLEVEALGGAPGVHSSRYAGPEATDADNNAKLLGALAGKSLAERRARFVCTLYFLPPVAANMGPKVFTGTLPGRITLEPKGAHGFGYDPLFLLEEPPAYAHRSLAELPAAAKNAISHRARAFAAFAAWLKSAAS